MKLIVFSKLLRDKSIDELAELALQHQFDGYDLCVRPGYPVSPDNAAVELPKAVKRLADSGLSVPMVTGNFDLLSPDHPTAKPILAAMDKAGVRLIKLGYYRFDPEAQEYWAEVDRIRTIFEDWERMGREYGVKICYHTHSGRLMGLNCATLAHLIRGFDPRYIGAFVDAGHTAIEGAEFPVGLSIVREYLSIVAVKDVLVEREEVNGHGRRLLSWVPAGQGIVDWTAVFDELKRVGYGGPVSVHCEFHVPEGQFWPNFEREVKFFRAQRERVA